MVSVAGCTIGLDSCWVRRHCSTFVMALAQPGDLSKCKAIPPSVLKHFIQLLSGHVIFTRAIGSLISDRKAVIFCFFERGIGGGGQFYDGFRV